MEGVAFRHLAPGFDPLSGEGARIAGGRYNPPDSFPALYLCTSLDCVTAEFERMGVKHPAGKTALLPRELYEYEFRFGKVLDLTSAVVLKELSISGEDLTVDKWDLCQSIGGAAHALGFQALRAPSATGVGDVLCVFPENLGAGTLMPSLRGVWKD
ncbi:MAG: RES family NAD+ phosphorylase [Actinomycetota bacterium]